MDKRGGREITLTQEDKQWFRDFFTGFIQQEHTTTRLLINKLISKIKFDRPNEMIIGLQKDFDNCMKEIYEDLGKAKLKVFDSLNKFKIKYDKKIHVIEKRLER